ncbi:MAG: MoaD/ThiS family protein [Deltaproteobacteria bacterium]|nr:MoaD/ThiS family protein [Deltaproteobacteria bacterium]
MNGIQIHIPAFLQIYTENKRRHYVNGSTILECLTTLAEHFPAVKSRLFNSDDSVRGELFIYLNKSQVRRDDFSRPLTDGDEIHISHVIVGG